MRNRELTHFDVLIIGGGPAGSSAAIGLAESGMNVAVVEKKLFPREVLCGEFLSHEVTHALRQFGLYGEFLSLRPTRITSFAFIPENGVSNGHPLGFEAWSLKRSLLDHLLLRRAEAAGATIIQPADIVSVERLQEGYVAHCETTQGWRLLHAGTVVGAYGKRSRLDAALKRTFVNHASGMSGVKYHVPRASFSGLPDSEILLFAAKDIYCGINRTNEDEVTLCFLTTNRMHAKDALRILAERNRGFRSLIRGDRWTELRNRPPHGAGNIFLGKKTVVENGIFMIGDAAAVIAPLAGDGIGMAIESGRLLARMLVGARRDSLGRRETESLYVREWKRLFRRRLSVAACLQGFAMNPVSGNLGGRLLKFFPQLTSAAVHWTRRGLVNMQD